MKTQRGVLILIIYLVAGTASSYMGTSVSLAVFSLAYSLFVLVLFLAGFGYILSGRNELGAGHRKCATIGCWLVPISILLSIFGLAGIFAGLPSALSVGSASSVTSALAVVIISVAVSSMAFVLIVYRLVGMFGKILLAVGFLSAIASVAVAMFGQALTANVLALTQIVSFILAYVIAYVSVSGMTPAVKDEDAPEWKSGQF